jgi:misacylated tRNA(Ala) deacylase
LVEKLFWKDAYLRDFSAKVTLVNGNSVTLDRTAFYPTGGGQPHDTGIITVKGKGHNVIEVVHSGDEILHILDSVDGIAPGDEAAGHINWERRNRLMRYHTAIHMLSATVSVHYPESKFTGGMIYEDKAHADFDCPSLNRDIASKIVEELQQRISESHPVSSKFISPEEASLMPGLVKTKPGEELTKSLSEIRIVDISDVDIEADGGTHVANTIELGKVRLSKFDNKGAHRKRIEITLEP